VHANSFPRSSAVITFAACSDDRPSIHPSERPVLIPRTHHQIYKTENTVMVSPVWNSARRGRNQLAESSFSKRRVMGAAAFRLTNMVPGLSRTKSKLLVLWHYKRSTKQRDDLFLLAVSFLLFFMIACGEKNGAPPENK